MYVLWLLYATVLAAIDMQPFNEAVRENPRSFMAYYKRATAFLSQNNDVQALRDLSKTLELNPGFEPGLYYHAKTNLRMGNTKEASKQLAKCDGRCSELLEECNKLEVLENSTLKEKEKGDFQECIFEASAALSIAPRAVSIRRARFECYMAIGDAGHAFSDLTEIVGQDKGDFESVSQLARIEFLVNGNQDKAMQLLRRCVNYDPEAKQCSSTSKQLREMQKEINKRTPKFNKLFKQISKEIVSMGLREDDVEQSLLIEQLRRRQCEYFVSKEDWAGGAEACARVRDVDPDFVPAILLQAHIELDNRNYQAALNLIRPLLQAGNNDPRIHQLYEEILGQSQSRQRSGQSGGSNSGKDLYKILDISKDATKKEIKKAYRALSRKFHPDKYKGGELSKEQVMEKMQEINEAHEILSDDQKRAEYDDERAGNRGGFQGGSQGGGPGGFQFQQGGFQGGGGPGGFDMNGILKQFMQQQQAQQQQRRRPR